MIEHASRLTDEQRLGIEDRFNHLHWEHRHSFSPVTGVATMRTLTLSREIRAIVYDTEARGYRWIADTEEGIYYLRKNDEEV